MISIVVPGVFNCDFDSKSTPLCGWIQEKGTDKFDWTLQSGKTGSTNTGPDDDHTGGKINTSKSTFV